jgi:hypothetical protein
MANRVYVEILKQRGPSVWNEWRKKNPIIQQPDLTLADLSQTDLSNANLMGTDLRGGILTETELNGANLRNANLQSVYLMRAKLEKVDFMKADLRGSILLMANLSSANLMNADLTAASLMNADLSGANLRECNLTGANLFGANLTGTDLTDANISCASLVNTNFTNAKLNGCHIYGCSAWNLNLENTEQSGLIISKVNEPLITVENLEVAQFIYLLLKNEKIHQIINTITSKVVLILGRFTSERKAILDAVKNELRNHNYQPVLFDFEKPASRNFTETVSTLAHMARFVIADITDAKSIPQELQKIVPSLPHVPIQPILLAGNSEYGMFDDFRYYPWVLPPFVYDNDKMLLDSLKEKIIAPAETKATEQSLK